MNISSGSAANGLPDPEDPNAVDPNNPLATIPKPKLPALPAPPALPVDAPVANPQDPSVAASAPTTPPVMPDSTSAAGTASPTDYSGYNNGLGMPAWLSAIYNKAGAQAQDRGTGFKDWQYWEDKPDQADRLKADLAGVGPDQPGPGDTGNTSGGYGMVNQSLAPDMSLLKPAAGAAVPSLNEAIPTTAMPGSPKADPYTSMGGGVQLPDGTWVPRSVLQQLMAESATSDSAAKNAAPSSSSDTKPLTSY